MAQWQGYHSFWHEIASAKPGDSCFHSQTAQVGTELSKITIDLKKSDSWIYYYGSERRALTGWKIHLAVAEPDVPRAWDLLIPIFEKHGVVHAKVTSPIGIGRHRPNKVPEYRNRQAGKFFAIYDPGHNGWQSLLDDIQAVFVNKGIEAGIPLADDRQIPGSPFFYYRCERDNKGQYISTEDLGQFPKDTRHNPFGHADPFKNIAIAPTGAEPRIIARNRPVQQTGVISAPVRVIERHRNAPQQESGPVRVIRRTRPQPSTQDYK